MLAEMDGVALSVAGLFGVAAVPMISSVPSCASPTKLRLQIQ
ncbi:hypothetical protein PC116_g15108 [Phytophthora cactorum]|nr:hypothetical protein Pcac1_g15781 [Phytophthora cactorum]KAG4236809.1 hypothetical protein PC116_g15108 [Phytophthora cactorum]